MATSHRPTLRRYAGLIVVWLAVRDDFATDCDDRL